MNTRILAPVAAVLAIGGAVTLAGDNDLIPSAKAGSFELSVGQLKINQRISSAAVRRANKNREDIAALQKGTGIVLPSSSGAGATSGGTTSGGSTSGGTTSGSTSGGTTSGGGSSSGGTSGGGSSSAPGPDYVGVSGLSTEFVSAEKKFTVGVKSLDVKVTCPTGYRVTGGGHEVGTKIQGEPRVRKSAPHLLLATIAAPGPSLGGTTPAPAPKAFRAWEVTVVRSSGAITLGTGVDFNRNGVRVWAACAKVTNSKSLA